MQNCKAVRETTSTSFAMKSFHLLSSKNGIVQSSQRVDGWPGLMGQDSGERAIRFAGQKCDRKSIFSQSACLSHPMQDVVGWLRVGYNIYVIWHAWTGHLGPLCHRPEKTTKLEFAKRHFNLLEGFVNKKIGNSGQQLKCYFNFATALMRKRCHPTTEYHVDGCDSKNHCGCMRSRVSFKSSRGSRRERDSLPYLVKGGCALSALLPQGFECHDGDHPAIGSRAMAGCLLLRQHHCNWENAAVSPYVTSRRLSSWPSDSTGLPCLTQFPPVSRHAREQIVAETFQPSNSHRTLQLRDSVRSWSLWFPPHLCFLVCCAFWCWALHRCWACGVHVIGQWPLSKTFFKVPN